MKKYNKKPNKTKVIKDLAEQFQTELNRKLPITVLPDGGIVYKDYLVKQNKVGNWTVLDYKQKTIVGQFFLKTCALMAAKAYSNVQLEKFGSIKALDTKYWASHCDLEVYRHNIKRAKEFDRYLILLNKIEDSETKEAYYKDEISKMFKWSFV